MDSGACGVEVLELQFADFAAVHGIGIIGPEALDIEFYHASADFFVGGEADFKGSVLEFRVLHDVLDGGHDFCDAGFVIGPEEGGAVRCDEGFSNVVKHFREFFGLQLQAWDAFEVDGAAVVPVDDLRLDVLAAGIRGGVYMGDESYGRSFHVAGNGCHYVAKLIQGGLHTHIIQLFAEHFQKVQLLCCRRLRLTFLI